MLPTRCSLLPTAVCLLLATLDLLPSTAAHAQSLGGASRSKSNLDLPYDALCGVDPDETVPEIVFIHGQQFEGDGFFFVVDRSGTMQRHGELQRAKQELDRLVSELSVCSDFGIVFFDAEIIKFPRSGRPARATATLKTAARAWIASVGGGSGSCCREGLFHGLQYVQNNSARRNVVIYIGDGGGSCAGSHATEQQYLETMVRAVTEGNVHRAQINAIGVIMRQSRTMHENILRTLTTRNRGHYTRIN